MEVILKHKTTDGTTYHEIDIEFSSNKKWGSQQKFVEKLILKEIKSLEGKMLIQKTTIADCVQYKSEGNLDITYEKLSNNRDRLEFLSSYEYGL